jgi:hypothetical protein
MLNTTIFVEDKNTEVLKLWWKMWWNDLYNVHYLVKDLK